MIFYLWEQHELLLWWQLWMVESALAATGFWLEVMDVSGEAAPDGWRATRGEG